MTVEIDSIAVWWNTYNVLRMLEGRSRRLIIVTLGAIRARCLGEEPSTELRNEISIVGTSDLLKEVLRALIVQMLSIDRRNNDWRWS